MKELNNSSAKYSVIGTTKEKITPRSLKIL